MELIALALCLALSLIANGIFFLLLRRLRAAKKERSLSIEASELLQDLATRGALVRFERIDPEHLFMWRPR